MDKKTYSVAEFRKCTREAFNLIDSQEDVYIERFGKKYIIIPESYYLELLKPAQPIAHKVGSGIAKSAPIYRIDASKGTAVATQVIDTPVPKEMLPKFCKEGHPIPYGRDKCLGKGCKYS